MKQRLLVSVVCGLAAAFAAFSQPLLAGGTLPSAVEQQSDMVELTDADGTVVGLLVVD